PKEMELAIEPPVWNPGAPYQGKGVVLRPFWLIAVIFIRSRVLSGPGRGVFRCGQQAREVRSTKCERRTTRDGQFNKLGLTTKSRNHQGFFVFW
ncbi:MAG TPA: hypothetical protein VMY18_05610, partial [Acidobacteriota bacterium]|nr:hypothetical protein [Acidobacteriota bacterium]